MIAATLVIAALGRAGHKERDGSSDQNPVHEVQGVGALAGGTGLRGGGSLQGNEHHGDIGTVAFSIPELEMGNWTLANRLARFPTADAFSIPGASARVLVSGVRDQQPPATADALIAARWLTSAAMYVPDVRRPVGVVSVLSDQRTRTASIAVSEDWAALLGQWSDWDVSTMLRIEDCESHFQNVVSAPDYDGIANYGPMQLHGDPRGMEPEYAAARSHEIWLAQGYRAWGCWGR